MSPFSIWTMALQRPFSPKMFRAEARDKQIYDMVADDYAYCELLLQNSLSLLEIQEGSIDANLVNIYLLNNFYIKNYGQNYCHFYVWLLRIQLFYEF